MRNWQKRPPLSTVLERKPTSEPPEQRWSDVFTYDDRSNLVSRTDARGVRTLISYSASGSVDPLNRLQSVSYDTSRVDSALTVLAAPTITSQYEQQSTSQPFDITRIKQVQASGVSVEDYSYDNQSRLHEKKLTLAGRTKAMTVTYGHARGILEAETVRTYVPEDYP